MTRWLKFHVVGVVGALVQLVILWIAAHVLEMPYLIATMVAVESAIIHNFLWHVRWTFSDRSMASTESCGNESNNESFPNAVKSFLKFQLSTGAVSIIGNTAIMWLLVDCIGAGIVAANCVAIATCSAANFLAADRFSFRHRATEERCAGSDRATLQA